MPLVTYILSGVIVLFILINSPLYGVFLVLPSSSSKDLKGSSDTLSSSSRSLTSDSAKDSSKIGSGVFETASDVL